MAPYAILLPVLLTIGSPDPGTKPVPPGPAATPINKSLLLQLVNDVRKKGCRCGDTWYPAAPTLAWNSKLEQAAVVHSNDMYANNYFSHADQQGSKAGDRLDDVGYPWRIYGENIAFGYRSERDVVKGWLVSPGHCKNIMNKAFREMGVSRVGDFWTQVFGSK